MGTFIVQLGAMSLQASAAVLAVLLLRKVFSWCGISKKYAVLLWVIPFWLLICPWKITSPMGIFSMAPSDYSAGYVEDVIKQQEQFSEQIKILQEGNRDDWEANKDAEWRSQGEEVSSPGQDGGQTDTNLSWRETVFSVIDNRERLWTCLTVVWLEGMLLFLVYAAISYCRLKRKLKIHIQKEKDVFCVDEIAVPMVVGLLKPRIYLPSGIEEAYIPFAVAHEKTHIRRKDILLKAVAYFITCIHWFNPVIWLAYSVLEKDIEMACDEETIQEIGTEHKKEYATALLQLAAGKRMIFAIPLAFGWGDTKQRIKNVMKYRKSVWIVTALGAVVGLLVLLVFMSKGSDGAYTAVLTNPGAENMTVDGVSSDAAEATEYDVLKQQELIAEMEAKEEEARAELEARREESEKQVLLTKWNQESELTFDIIRQAMKKQVLHELDFAKFTNGENLKEEATYSLNYYINFYFKDTSMNPEGEEYRLGVSFLKEDDSLRDIYITRISDTEMRWLYSAESGEYRDVLEEFLVTKERITDWLTVELPKGYTLGNYNANYGYEGGALIYPQAYEVYGEDVFAPADWYHAGCISRIPDAAERYEFIDGKLQPHHGTPWNHTSAEFVEVLELDWQTLFMEVNHDLYTAAGMGWLEEDGINITQIDTTSDYWYFFFVKEGEDTAYYLSLSKNCFTKEEALAIAETVDIKEAGER